MNPLDRKHPDDALIALALGDAPASADARRWLASGGRRRALAAYERVLASLDRLYGGARPVAARRAGAARAGVRRPARALRVYTTAMRTPIGHVALAASARGLVRVAFGVHYPALRADLVRRLGAEVIEAPEKMAGIVRQLERYFAGKRRAFDIPVDLVAATPFQRRVLLATRRVPAGRVVSYGDIARRIGQPRASRAVGQALGHNPVPIVIPCHRIVAGGGGLGGYTGGLRIKKRLLAIEGANPRLWSRAAG